MKKLLSARKLSVCVVLGASLLSHVAAAQDASRYTVSSSSGFGSGPMTVSLLGSARFEAPVRGIDPVATPESSAPALMAGLPGKTFTSATAQPAPEKDAVVAKRTPIDPAGTEKEVALAR